MLTCFHCENSNWTNLKTELLWKQNSSVFCFSLFVSKSVFFSLYFFFLMFIDFWERETECRLGRDRERGRHRVRSRLHAPSCQHRARRGARTAAPGDHDLSQSRTLNRLSHPGAPHLSYFKKYFWTITMHWAVLYFKVLIYFERERSTSREGQRRRERESQAGSVLPARACHGWGSNSQTVRSWPEPKPTVRCLTNLSSRVPQNFLPL